jgi:ubiquinone biosynthesis protein
VSLRSILPGASDTFRPSLGLLRSLRNFARLVRICLTLARHDALSPLRAVPAAAPFLWFGLLIARDRDRERLRPGQRLAAAFEELGPSFIKLGQLLSTRADLLGEEITVDLASLQDRLPPFPGSEAQALIEAEFGCPLGGLFASFDQTAVAAASIAQVHFARTTDGHDVAVKVLRPRIAEAFARDLNLFLWLAGLSEWLVPAMRRLKPVEVIQTLAEVVRFEMDLRLEAAAAAELAENFAGDPDFRVPRVDWLRTGRTVLTLARVNGIHIDDRAAIIAAGHRIESLLEKAAVAFFNQVFRDGFFHADLHPGNMFVEADGAIAVVDFGIMGRLDRDTRFYLADMLIGFLSGDYRRVAEVHFAAGYVPPGRSVDAFTQACRSIGEPILGKPLQEISVARLLAQLFEITEQFEMETQPQLLLLQKTMVVIEGVGRRLDPEINIWALGQPLIEEWMRANRGPEARARLGLETIADLAERLPRLVRNLETLVTTWSREGVVLHLETLAAHAAHRGRHLAIVLIPAWITALALAGIAIALLFK